MRFIVLALLVALAWLQATTREQRMAEALQKARQQSSEP